MSCEQVGEMGQCANGSRCQWFNSPICQSVNGPMVQFANVPMQLTELPLPLPTAYYHNTYP